MGSLDCEKLTKYWQNNGIGGKEGIGAEEGICGRTNKVLRIYLNFVGPTGSNQFKMLIRNFSTEKMLTNTE